MPGLKKTSGKKSYGAPGNKAKRGNTKKRVRGQAKKRARRAGKKAANESVRNAIREKIQSEIFNMVVSEMLGESAIREGKESKILDFLKAKGIEDVRFVGPVLHFGGGMQVANKGKELLLKDPRTPLNKKGKAGLRQHYNMIMWNIPGHVGGTGPESRNAASMAVEATTEKHKMSRDEWNKMPKDYKLIKNGQKYALIHDKGAAVLAPVELTEAPKSLRELPKNGDRVEGPLGFYGKVVQKDGATVTVDWGDAGADDYNIDSLKKLRSGLWKVR